ncbi:MAG: 2-amino-4-hydroxy-6-hydroxymethyldihydropteridine diphosphokinase [Prevotella sp.]|jgi:2-amino-4-hydroxy-6-hydroxymethyldihydropteridine diphosphokinase|nr:2-amino-4-hydroxy-6-hydroxymethyldihydropteridine diphosphokinase [Prevotella sp.]
MHEVYLSLGSNLGDREQQLKQAIRFIDERIGEVVRQSSFIETEPWGFQSDHRFLNAAICCLTDKTPREVLQLTQQIERDLGKTKAHATHRPSSITHHPSSITPHPSALSPQPSYFNRPIDIDILLYDDWKVSEPDLKIPHPLMHQRDFVMIPLKEIMTEQTNP